MEAAEARVEMGYLMLDTPPGCGGFASTPLERDPALIRSASALLMSRNFFHLCVLLLRWDRSLLLILLFGKYSGRGPT